MIMVTRYNGGQLALNCDLIERVEASPETVLTLVDGTNYVIDETVDDVIAKVREFRASIMAMAGQIECGAIERPVTPLRVLRREPVPDGSDQAEPQPVR